MSPSVRSLPEYLKRYCSEQFYDRYTARDHAAWRYIMRRSRAFFSKRAVPIYLSGLKATGIPLDRIPKISEMDEALQRFGWGAVAVCGFIPPAAFLEFQARRVLAIATDMRSLEHIGYTPAPDIVHEAAGHAPIVADEKYRKYLEKYADIAARAIISKEDINLYEAIRLLSDAKENPDMSDDDVEIAQKKLDAAVKNMTYVSEATKLARMAWWTVEYGLVGELSEPKIYGAGLLSSVGESQHCLSDRVKKIPLTLKCIDQSYDITEPQPQLFVAKDMDQLETVLEELEELMAYRRGGIYGLNEIKKAATVNSIAVESSIEVSGVLAAYEAIGEDVTFVKFSGPSQICYKGIQLNGHGRDYHKDGFSSPLGRWKLKSDRAASSFSENDVNALGLVKGKTCKLELVSGFEVQGDLEDMNFFDGKLGLMSWKNCTVKKGSQIYFQPEWGTFDLVVGEKIISAFGGPSDKAAYGDYEMGETSTSPGRTSPFTAEERKLFAQYQSIRDLRCRLKADGLKGKEQAELAEIAKDSLQKPDGEWLIKLELLELAEHLKLSDFGWKEELYDQLQKQMSTGDASHKELIQKGLEVIKNPD